MNTKKFYSNLLYFYPESYRKSYGKEMERVFCQMYKDEKVGILFWTRITTDMIVSGVGQHLNELGEKGFRGYFKDTLYFNGFNLAGFILLLPFLLLFCIELFSRIAQGDLTHYNRAVYIYLSQTPFYRFPLQAMWILILPSLALVLNLISLIFSTSQTKIKVKSLKFIKVNFFSLVIIGLGMFCLLLVFGHDVIPCTVHGLFRGGFNHFFEIADYCGRNA